ncbi:MAG: diguanylate cyclase [Pseudomonadota bacterium]
MPGRILIVDSVATNRIVLKVKMLTAQYVVDACADVAMAEPIIAKNPPDLVLINLAQGAQKTFELCKRLRQQPTTRNMGIIAIGAPDNAQTRLSALDAGVDDVMSHPVNDVLLLARIRSLMRVRGATEELLLRDSTSRALGFEEDGAIFDGAGSIGFVSDATVQRRKEIDAATNGLAANLQEIAPTAVLRVAAETHGADLYIVDAAKPDDAATKMFGLVSDMRARSETRQSAQLIIVPVDRPELAAMFLDLGADDVVAEDAEAKELLLRATVLMKRKQQQDRLRDTVRDGLHAAVTDPLTGLFNRRYVDAHLPRLAEQAEASDRTLAVMMLDIDHFKAINDKYGHPVGDAILVEMAQRLQENLRGIDLVARMGGEEFLIAMPRTSVAQAQLAADRLCRVIKITPFLIGDDGPQIAVTASIGVAVTQRGANAEQTSTERICKLADEALYAAKTAGRDRVAMSKSAA